MVLKVSILYKVNCYSYFGYDEFLRLSIVNEILVKELIGRFFLRINF